MQTTQTALQQSPLIAGVDGAVRLHPESLAFVAAYPLNLRELLRLRLLRKKWLLQAGGGFLMRMRQQLRELCGASLCHGDSEQQTLSDGRMHACLPACIYMGVCILHMHACMPTCMCVQVDICTCRYMQTHVKTMYLPRNARLRQLAASLQLLGILPLHRQCLEQSHRRLALALAFRALARLAVCLLLLPGVRLCPGRSSPVFGCSRPRLEQVWKQKV